MLISCERPSQLSMLWQINNELWPCMLWKKLAMVKDYVIVHCANIVYLGEGVHTDRGYRYLVGDLHNAYVVANYEFWSSMLWKK